MQCSTTVARRTRASTASGTAGRAPAWTGASGRLPTATRISWARAASQPATSSGAHPTSTTSTPRCRRTSASGSSGSPTTSGSAASDSTSARGTAESLQAPTPVRACPSLPWASTGTPSTTVRAWSTTRTRTGSASSTGSTPPAASAPRSTSRPRVSSRRLAAEASFGGLWTRRVGRPASSASGPDARSPSSTTTIPVPPSRTGRSPATRLAWATRTPSRTLGHPRCFGITTLTGATISGIRSRA
mmetsp:Transcript_548/g.2048  ORF Transcript_548/g.2048 Transcript_548/m.2048 type:complete len:245 (-) Transcript_548:385-1119(-)